MNDLRSAGEFERAAKLAEAEGKLSTAHDLYMKAAQLALGKGRRQRNLDACKRIEVMPKAGAQ